MPLCLSALFLLLQSVAASLLAEYVAGNSDPTISEFSVLGAGGNFAALCKFPEEN